MKERARPGDILFYSVTPQSGWVARFIAMAQFWRKEGVGSVQYSHVSIVLRDTNYQVEAYWPRIRKSKINWSDDNLELCEIRGISEKQRCDMIIYAMEAIGQWYDLGTFFFGLFNFKNAEICTTLVRSTAAAIGVRLGYDYGKLLTPNELRNDVQLREK